MESERVKFIDILLLLARGKKFIFFFTLGMSIFALIYTLIVTELWTSEATILPIDTTSSLNISSALLEGFGFADNVSIKALDLKYAGVLKSRKITEQVIEKFNFINYFKIKVSDPIKAMEYALNEYHKRILKITITEDTDFLTIAVTTKDKYLSKEIAGYYLEILYDYITNTANNTGSQKRELFESRLTQITIEMSELSEEMRKYQAKHNIVDIENQAKASIEAYSMILDEFFKVELELEYAEKYTPNTLGHKNLVDKKISITETLKKIEKNNNETPFLLAMSNINSNVFTVKEGIFKMKIYEMLLETLYPQLELARIEELEKMDKYEIIDYPNLPGIRAYPKRALICIITFIIAFLFSSAYVLLRESTSEDDREKIKELWNKLFH